MERFQIVEITGDDRNAGTKATADIAAVADSLGFQRVCIRKNVSEDSPVGKLRRQAGYFFDWKRACAEIPAHATVLLQHPFHHKQLTREKSLNWLREKKGVRFISVVHDVEELRVSRFDDYYAREFEQMLRLADALIVHNSTMLEWFVSRGVPSEKLVNLEIFDYLPCGDGTAKTPAFEKTVTIAGNLDVQKSAYIAQLGDVAGVSFKLYGPNYDRAPGVSGNIRYFGSLPPDELPDKLCGGFGLVWDGASLDGCQGPMGQYLKYNNPHKLSLYLCAGLPVIIWQEAAEADLVRRMGVGLCVGSLRELGPALEGVSAADYRRMAENAGRLGAKLREGFHSRKAIGQAMRILGGTPE